MKSLASIFFVLVIKQIASPANPLTQMIRAVAASHAPPRIDRRVLCKALICSTLLSKSSLLSRPTHDSSQRWISMCLFARPLCQRIDTQMLCPRLFSYGAMGLPFHFPAPLPVYRGHYLFAVIHDGYRIRESVSRHGSGLGSAGAHIETGNETESGRQCGAIRWSSL